MNIYPPAPLVGATRLRGLGPSVQYCNLATGIGTVPPQPPRCSPKTTKPSPGTQAPRASPSKNERFV